MRHRGQKKTFDAACAKGALSGNRLSRLTVGLRHPVTDRLCRGLELPSQFLRTPSGPNKFNYLMPEFRRVRSVWLAIVDSEHSKLQVSANPVPIALGWL